MIGNKLLSFEDKSNSELSGVKNRVTLFLLRNYFIESTLNHSNSILKSSQWLTVYILYFTDTQRCLQHELKWIVLRNCILLKSIKLSIFFFLISRQTFADITTTCKENLKFLVKVLMSFFLGSYYKHHILSQLPMSSNAHLLKRSEYDAFPMTMYMKCGPQLFQKFGL